MTQSNQPLGWLKKLVPTTLRDSVRSAISGGESAPAVAPSPATETASTYVVFLPRDPQWAYCFWSISSADQQRARKAGATSLCLRVADVTGLGFEQSHPHALQELVVDGAATEWFLPMPVDGRDYRVELGYRLRNGGWLSLAFSSVAHVPALDPSQRVADAFVPFSLDGPMGPASEPIGGGGGVQHEQLYQIATARPARSRLTGMEFNLLELLISRSGEPISRLDMLEKVWGYKPERSSDSRVVDVHISRLRAKLEEDPDNPELILTARGMGYMFQRIHQPAETAGV
ncbi:MAG: DUF4912 domain-containing protein [Vulcanococcus sp.]